MKTAVPSPATARDRLERHPIFAAMILILMLVVIVATVLEIPHLGANGAIVDFDAFYIVSQMLLEGRLTDAYDPDIMRATQSEIAGKSFFMPWTYPPPFDLVVAPFALVPRGVAYAAFMLLTLGAYVLVLRRLAGPYLPAVLVAVFPALLICTRVGQNGFLIAAVIGTFALLWLDDRHRSRAGLPLGLLVCKPHLGVGLGVLVLLSCHWRVLAIGLATVAGLCLLSLLAFGAEAWSAFLDATRFAGESMEKGLYPLFRMTSAYAFAFSLGLPTGAALALHGVLALLALAAIAATIRAGWPPRQQMGVALIATLAVSPYNYDYDMATLGLALAVLAPDLIRHGHWGERLALLAATWLCTGSGLYITLYLMETKPDEPNAFLSLGGLGFAVLALLIARILRRAQAAGG